MATAVAEKSPLGLDNPMGTDGFEFVEYTAPDPQLLRDLFTKMGFPEVARHKRKDVTLHRQGDCNFIINAQAGSFAESFAREHGPSACAMAFRVKDAKAAHQRALRLGATNVDNDVVDGELDIPAIEGIGGSRLFFVDRYGAEGSIYDVDFDFHPDWQQRMAALTTRENDLESQLGRARYEVYGVAVPPDATFSLRFSDGVVRGYPYNGTIAPPFTTFYGVYDHYHSYGPDTPWRLPAKWLPVPPSLDLSTKLNFPATSDTIGGNSGSPMVNRDLELVGLNFDRTIEGLLRDYIYLPNRGRNVAVDARAILEALDAVYDMDALVAELQAGRLPNR